MKLSWPNLSSIQSAGMISLPLVTISMHIGQSLPLHFAILSILVGNIFLFLTGSALLYAHPNKEMNTPELIESKFGKFGIFFNMILSIGFIFWFSVQLNIIVQIILNIAKTWNIELNFFATIAFVAAINFHIVSKKIKGMQFLAKYFYPVLLITLMISYLKSPAIALASFSISFPNAVSLIVLSAIVGICDLPTYYKNVKSFRNSIKSMALTFLLVIPMTQIMCIFIGHSNPSGKFLDILGNGDIYWQSWVAFFLVIAGLTTNNINLYSSNIIGQRVTGLNFKNNLLFISFLGFFIALFPFNESLNSIINYIAPLALSLVFTLISFYFVNHTAKSAFLTWSTGTCFSLLSSFNIFSITNTVFLDTFLGSFLMSLFSNFLSKKSKHIEYDQLESLALGATLLGAGGGGNTLTAKLMAQQALKEKNIKLIHPSDLSSTDFILPVGIMGSPLIMSEKLPSGKEFKAIYDAICKNVGKNPTAILPAGIGGANPLFAIFCAAELNLPLVDGDGVGRTFPKLNMTTFNLSNCEISPTILSDIHGNTTVVNAQYPEQVEVMARQIAVSYGSMAAFTFYPQSGKELKKSCIAGTISHAISLGEIIQNRDNPIESILEASQGILLAEGTITDLFQDSPQNHFCDRVFIKNDLGQETCVSFQNENLLVEQEGIPLAMAPDIISIIDSDSGKAISSESLHFGLKVKILALPAPEQWITEEGLKLVGPKIFGLDLDYISFQQLRLRPYRKKRRTV